MSFKQAFVFTCLLCLAQVSFAKNLKHDRFAAPPPPCGLSGTYSVGTGGTFATIGKAMDSLKNGGIGGDVILELVAGYTSTAEIFPITLPGKTQIPCFTTQHVTIRPASNATDLKIIGAHAFSIFTFDATTNFIIDGRPGGTGTGSQLSIINNQAAAILLVNATFNTIKYTNCMAGVLGLTPISQSGVINFNGGSTAGTGCKNNTIESCDIHSGSAGFLVNDLIYGYATNGSHNTNSVINCRLHNFGNTAVNLTKAEQWTFTGNSIYSENARNYGLSPSFFKIGHSFDATGTIISNNYFGGTGPECSGAPMSISFLGSFQFLSLFSKAQVQNNKFRRIRMEATSANDEAKLLGFGYGSPSTTGTTSLAAYNEFGGLEPADSIHFRFITTQTNAKSNLSMIWSDNNTNPAEVTHNTFNRIYAYSSGNDKVVECGIISGCIIASYNTIGSPQLYNSIVNNTAASTMCIMSYSGGKAFNNIISNITNTSVFDNNGGSTVSSIWGIYNMDSARNNQVYRLVTNTNTGTGNYAIVGIHVRQFAGGNAGVAMDNTVHSLINKGPGGNIMGIFNTSTMLADKNFVYALVNENSANLPGSVTGILGEGTLVNNMISLGTDTAGISPSYPAKFVGASGSTVLTHNTISITGENPGANGSGFSYCYANGNTNSVSTLRNNIFSNTRTNIVPTNTTTQLCIGMIPGSTSNYNLFNASGNGGAIALYNFNKYTTLAQWQATGKDLNSLYGDAVFVNEGGTYLQRDLHLQNGTIAEAAGTASSTLSEDFDGEIRSGLTPVDIGADAGNFNNCAIANAGNSSSSCAGTNVQIGTAAVPGYNYSWTSNPTGYTSTVANPTVAPVVTTTYYLEMRKPNGTCISKDTVVLTVNTAVTPTISITTPSVTVCSGSTVEFSSSITNGGSNPSYQWLVNNVDVNNNHPSYVTTTLADGDKVRCILTSNAGCVSSNAAESNTITMAVTASVTPTISIIADKTDICPGETVYFMATANNGGSNAQYQWKVNNVNAGTNNPVFNSSTLTNNAEVKVTMASSLGCAVPATVTSNVITIHVTPGTAASAGPDVGICSGSSTELQGSGGGTYAWSPATGLNNPNIAHPIATPAITTQYILTVSNGSCSSKDTMVVTVGAAVVPEVHIVATQTSICTGTNVTFTATPTNGGSNPVYQWKVNNINVGSNSPVFSSSTLTNNAEVKVTMASSLGCATPAVVTSNVIVMTVTPMPVAHAGTDTTICAGSSVELHGSGGGTYSWSPATGLSNPNIASPVATPAATTQYILTVSNNGCSSKDTMTVFVSTAVSVSVSISTTQNNACVDTAIVFVATPVNGGNAHYEWSVNGVAMPDNNSLFSSNILQNGDKVRVKMLSSLACVVNPLAESNTITMNLQELAVPLVAANNRLFTVTNPDAAATYRWQVLTNNQWANVNPPATGITYTAPEPGTYRVRGEKSPCIKYSAASVASFTARTPSANPYGIYLYPNPSTDFIRLDSLNQFHHWKTIEFVNANGMHVLPTMNILNRNAVSVRISELPKGLYFAILRKWDEAFTVIPFVRQ